MAWNDGYVSDIDYTRGYYSDFSPTRMKFVMSYLGFKAPEISNAYELGIGYGLNLIFNGTGGVIKWSGNDFNPRHVTWAKDLNILPDQIEIEDFSFEELSNQKFHKKFEYICLHGIWSWISQENQENIKKFIRNNLNVGGVLYISYNVFPGWSDFLPIRNLMQQTVAINGSSVTEKTINEALDFAEQVIISSPKLKQNAPNLKNRLDYFKKQPNYYVAHELLNKDWNLTDFGQISKTLKEIKLEYAGSANLKEYISQINFTEEQSEFLNTINSSELRETTGDILKGQAFRSEFWIKGGYKLTKQERKYLLESYKFILVRLNEESELKISGLRTSATLQSEIYSPILDALSDLEPKSINQIRSKSLLNVSDEVLYEAILILTAHGSILPVNELPIVEQISARAKQLNKRIIEKAFNGDEINFLLSPVTGTGVLVNKLDKFFIFSNGMKEEEIIKLVKETLINLNENLVMDGKIIVVDSSEGNQLIRKMFQQFKNKSGLYRALKIMV